MVYYKEFTYHFGNIVGKKKKVDNTIYTFDIETSNYLLLDDKIIPACDYLKLNKEQRQKCKYGSNMYIWMFGINNVVYYGRTWEELKSFLIRLEFYNSHKKIVFVHNLSFEFQYLKTIFKFQSVTARKKRKVMKAILTEFNIEFHCSYMMSNCSLEILPKVFKLPVEKKVGDLDYNLIRTSITELTTKEMRIL